MAREGAQRERPVMRRLLIGGLPLCQDGDPSVKMGVWFKTPALPRPAPELCHRAYRAAPMIVATRVSFIGADVLADKGFDPGGDGRRAA